MLTGLSRRDTGRIATALWEQRVADPSLDTRTAGRQSWRLCLRRGRQVRRLCIAKLKFCGFKMGCAG